MDFNLKDYVQIGAAIIENLPKYLSVADLSAKQQIIGSICPEKLIFEKNKYRTIRFNDVIHWIFTKGKGSGGSKKDWPPFSGANPIKCPGLDSNQHVLANAAT